MRKRIVLTLLLGMFASVSTASADLVFNFRQQGGNSPIVVGNSAVFELVVFSTQAGAVVDGYDIYLDIVNSGAGGQFTEFVLPGNFQSGLWNPDPYSPSLIVGTTPFTFTTTSTEYIAGTLTLSTVGATPGVYDIVWNPESAGIGPSGIFNSQFNHGVYSIAIPEPTSWGVISLGVAAVLAVRRRRVT